MIKGSPVRLIPIALAAILVCLPENGVLAEQCAMRSRTLDTKSSGPLLLEVFGADTLCIEPEGNANLAPYTPTVRIRNTGPDPITVRYQLDPARSFRSTAIWPAGRSQQSVDFNDVSGLGSTQLELMGVGEELLISSWTRHNDAIRNRVLPSNDRPVSAGPQDFVVRFDLEISYSRGGGTTPVSATFTIPLRAVPR
jgi:hypothetical protein